MALRAKSASAEVDPNCLLDVRAHAVIARLVVCGQEPSVDRSSDISPAHRPRHPRPAYPALPYRFIAFPGLDARRGESGSNRDMRDERDGGERAVTMEADKVRNWVCGTRAEILRS